MYIPSAFRVDSENRLHRAIERWNFGLLIDSGGDGHNGVTHVPFLLDRTQQVLYTHLAGSNPQSDRLDGQRVVAVFQGPHAYISPGEIGDPTRNVPTWNYIAVHAHGRARRLTGPTARAALERIVAAHEQGGWSGETLEPALRQRLEDAIAVFAIDIDALDGCWKLSQNKNAHTRLRLARALRRRPSQSAHELAEALSAGITPARSRTVEWLRTLRQRIRGRRQLCQLDQRGRADIGIGQEQLRIEANKPFWRR